MSTENQALQPGLVSLAATDNAPVSPTPIHIQDLSLAVKGLIRRLEYKYVIEGLGANWPVAIVPISGSFIADSRTANINVKAVFCPNFTLCPSGSPDVLGYNRNYSYGTEDVLLFSTVRAKVSELSSNTDFLYSQPTTLSCSGCLPVVGPKVTLPNSIILNTRGHNSIMITGMASGLSPDTRYSYTFKVLDSTWPVEMYPLSGTVKGGSDELMVFSQLVFCENSGLYDTDMCGTDKDKRATISLELQPLPDTFETVSILSTNSTTKLVSNDGIVQCRDCLPASPTIILSATPSTINKKNSTNIACNFANLKANKQYSYSLENIDSNWPLFIPDSSGSFKTAYNTNTINLVGEFCSPSVLCPSGMPNVVSYILDSGNMLINEFNNANTSTWSSMRLKLVDHSTGAVYYSNKARIDCGDCSQAASPTVIVSQVLDNPSCQ